MTLELQNPIQDILSENYLFEVVEYEFIMNLIFFCQLHQQMENNNYESETSILSAEQIEEIVTRKVSPLYTPR